MPQCAELRIAESNTGAEDNANEDNDVAIGGGAVDGAVESAVDGAVDGAVGDALNARDVSIKVCICYA